MIRSEQLASRQVEPGPPPTRAAQPVARSEPFLSTHPRMLAIRAVLEQIALSDVPVVLRGESGVGKEVLAHEIHDRSPRAAGPFLKINCAALPLELLESELFGYERGAFTGAVKSTPGQFEIADRGVILLDEIGDMDFKLQAKLLHVLQDGEFQRLGGRETICVNVRVLAATHCDLERAVEERQFREDLYYRLNVISIEVPPLRERREDILPLSEYLLGKHAMAGIPRPEITAGLREALLAYTWPGNVRELENVIRKLLVFGDPEMIALELRRKVNASGWPSQALSCQSPHSDLTRASQAYAQAEAGLILEALHNTHWNRKQAAQVLNIDYKGLLYKMRKLGINSCRAR
jgi:two-component system response regulator AtoC